jgi:hypothetical protein
MTHQLVVLKVKNDWNYTSTRDRGKSLLMGRFPNMGRYIISYQEVLRSELKHINHQEDEIINCNHIINDQLLKNSVGTGRLCFGAL